MKKVSVVVPVYNVEHYLRKCLDSLVNQTLENIEIVVVNDGSKDDSQKIIEEFQQKYPDKIVSFQKENGGLSDARNFGIDNCNGEFIGFVDSDDYVSENMFEEMYNLAQLHNAEMVVCNLQKVDEYGGVTQRLTQIPNMPEKIILKDHLSVFSDLSYFACNKIFHKKLFNQQRFKKGVHFEDIELIPKLLLQSKTIAFTPKYHYHYLERMDSITKTHTLKGLDVLSAVHSVEVFFNKSEFAENKSALKNFQILQGVYSFLAYLAFVKNNEDFYKMSETVNAFMKKNQLKIKDLLLYRRFGKNYLLSLPTRKKIYYLLYFFGCYKLIRKLI